MLTATHIRAARALIGARQSDLAKSAGVSLATLNNIERGIGDPRASTLRAIEAALNQAGVMIEDSPGHLGVMIERLSRPRLPEPYQASEAIMTAIGPKALFIAERIVVFGRSDNGGAAPRFCVALMGPVRTQVFDRSALVVNTPSGAAEVCGILMAAFAYRRKVLNYVDHLLDDTTQLGDLELVARLEAARPKPMSHPAQIVDVLDDWARISVTYVSWKSHPARDLLRIFGPAPARSA
ncbi:MAG: helix-turn-helix domain-containing protein [Alphaproteobacteria bacterium]